MAIISNYTTLVSACQNVMEDDGTEYKAYIPTAIGLAEERLNREIDSDAFVTTTFTSVSISTVIKIPSNLKVPKEVAFYTATSADNRYQRPLIRVPSSFAHEYWPYGNSSVGHPKYYHGPDKTGNWYIVPACSASIWQIRLLYEKKVEQLTAASSVNLFTEKWPDALFYATMIQMSRFARNPDMEAMFEKDYQNALMGIHNETRRFRRDDTVNPLNDESNVNTLKGDN